MPIDRGDAVNLARNIERNPHLKVTSIGVLGLASAVLAMDEALRASPSEAEGEWDDALDVAIKECWRLEDQGKDDHGDSWMGNAITAISKLKRSGRSEEKE